MRQLNYLFLFSTCLVIVLFALQNSTPVTVKLIQTIQFEMPLSVAMIVSMGVGALTVWTFSVWSVIQQFLQTRLVIKSREVKIRDLVFDLAQYQTALDPSNPAEQQRLLSAGNPD